MLFVFSFLGGRSMSPKTAPWPLEKLCSPIPEFLHSQENWILFCYGNLCQERIYIWIAITFGRSYLIPYSPCRVLELT